MSLRGSELSDLGAALMSGHLSSYNKDYGAQSIPRRRRSTTVYNNDRVNLSRRAYRLSKELFDQQLARIDESDDLEQLGCGELKAADPGDGSGSADSEELEDFQSDSSEDEEPFSLSHLSNYDPRLLCDSMYREEPEDSMDCCDDCVDVSFTEDEDEAYTDSIDESTDSEENFDDYTDFYSPNYCTRFIEHVLLSGSYLQNLEVLDRLAQDQPGSFISVRTIERPILARRRKKVDVKKKPGVFKKQYLPSPLSSELHREDISAGYN